MKDEGRKKSGGRGFILPPLPSQCTQTSQGDGTTTATSRWQTADKSNGGRQSFVGENKKTFQVSQPGRSFCCRTTDLPIMRN
jgi:hypothetical protein